MIRAYISEDDFGRKMKVFILNEYNEETMILRRRDGGVYAWEAADTAASQAIDPTFELSMEVAQAVLDGLTKHLKGASDVHQLQDHLRVERSRVDRLIEHLAVAKR